MEEWAVCLNYLVPQIVCENIPLKVFLKINVAIWGLFSSGFLYYFQSPTLSSMIFFQQHLNFNKHDHSYHLCVLEHWRQVLVGDTLCPCVLGRGIVCIEVETPRVRVGTAWQVWISFGADTYMNCSQFSNQYPETGQGSGLNPGYHGWGRN